MHGGTISAASDGLGRGATFSLEFEPVGEQEVDEPAPVGSGAAQGGRSEARVLLVEDHADTARILARLLRLSGYQVETAHSAASALEVAGAGVFDIVVSDIGLPDGTGYRLMEQIRERHGIKGIALSGYGMEDDLRKSRDAGFVEHIVKPVNVQELCEVIDRVTRE
jgi:two-component system, chemotaxis family, CheB/CheR fusion protein